MKKDGTLYEAFGGPEPSSRAYHRVAFNGQWYWVQGLKWNSDRTAFTAHVVTRHGEATDKVLVGTSGDLEECFKAKMNLTYAWLEKGERE